MLIYPNPVGEQLHITGAAEGEPITLYNLSGRPVWSTIADAGEAVLDTADLPAGIYFCRLQGRTFKVVKQ